MSIDQNQLTVRLKIKSEFHDYNVTGADTKDLHKLLANLYQTRYILISTMPNLQPGKMANRRLSALSRIVADIIIVKSELYMRGQDPQDHFATEFLERAGRLLPPDVMKKLLK